MSVFKTQLSLILRNNCDLTEFYNCLFLILFLFAESSAVGRVNTPGKANLALRARIARQGSFVGNG